MLTTFHKDLEVPLYLMFIINLFSFIGGPATFWDDIRTLVFSPNQLIMTQLCHMVWWHRSESALVQVVPGCLSGWSHYLNQCRLIITSFTGKAPGINSFMSWKNSLWDSFTSFMGQFSGYIEFGGVVVKFYSSVEITIYLLADFLLQYVTLFQSRDIVKNLVSL